MQQCVHILLKIMLMQTETLGSVVREELCHHWDII